MKHGRGMARQNRASAAVATDITWQLRTAEAEIDRLRAELANVHHNAEMWYAEKLRAEAANDRVRALCEPGVAIPSEAALYKATILHALDGGTE